MIFLVVVVTHNHTTEHTYTRLTFVVSLVDNEFSSKYCCVGLITVTNSVLTYHKHQLCSLRSLANQSYISAKLILHYCYCKTADTAFSWNEISTQCFAHLASSDLTPVTSRWCSPRYSFHWSIFSTDQKYRSWSSHFSCMCGHVCSLPLTSSAGVSIWMLWGAVRFKLTGVHFLLVVVVSYLMHCCHSNTPCATSFNSCLNRCH